MFFGYKYPVVSGKQANAVKLKTKKAVAHFVMSDLSEKVITDEMNNFVLDTVGVYINRLNPDYQELREEIIAAQKKAGY